MLPVPAAPPNSHDGYFLGHETVPEETAARLEVSTVALLSNGDATGVRCHRIKHTAFIAYEHIIVFQSYKASVRIKSNFKQSDRYQAGRTAVPIAADDGC